MLQVSQALWELDNEYHEYVLEMSEDLMEHAPSAIPDFIKSCPKALERVTILQLQQWYLEGVRVLQRNRDAGMAYFRLESAHSQSELDALSANIEFERIKDLMEMYCQALAGAEVKVAASEELAEKRIGWLTPDSPTTEGSTVYVPAIADRYETKEENFALFKVVSTHQVARLEFGSFWFEFDTPSTVFKDLRPRLEREVLEAAKSNGDGTEWVTDIQRLFGLLEDRRLSLDLFTIIEGGRLDIRVLTEYLGMRKSYARVQGDALAARPEITQMPAREAMVEFLVRVTLRADESLPTPVEYVEEARKIASIARRANAFGTTVEDTAEAMLRIYAVLIQIPNVPLDEDEFQDLDLGDDDESSMESEAEDDIIQSLMEGLGAESQEKSPGEQEYETSQDVDYRGDFQAGDGAASRTASAAEGHRRFRRRRYARDNAGDAPGADPEQRGARPRRHGVRRDRGHDRRHGAEHAQRSQHDRAVTSRPRAGAVRSRGRGRRPHRPRRAADLRLRRVGLPRGGLQAALVRRPPEADERGRPRVLRPDPRGLLHAGQPDTAAVRAARAGDVPQAAQAGGRGGDRHRRRDRGDGRYPHRLKPQ